MDHVISHIIINDKFVFKSKYRQNVSDEKVNASSTKSTSPGKGTTESEKQSTGSER